MKTLIHPEVTEDNLELFLRNHLTVDIEVLESTLSKNKEDVLLWLHIILHRMLKKNATIGMYVKRNHHMHTSFKNGILNISNAEIFISLDAEYLHPGDHDKLEEWEKAFQEQFIAPVHQVRYLN